MTDSMIQRNRLNTKLRYKAQKELKNEHPEEYQELYTLYGDTTKALRELARNYPDDFIEILRWVQKVHGFLPLMHKAPYDAVKTRNDALLQLISIHNDEYRNIYKEYLLQTSGNQRWQIAKNKSTADLRKKYYDEYSKILDDIRQMEKSGNM